ncbi:MAG: response regulator [Phycisphaerae bacterium]|nr:response regulator [Phycisphaerae bacterium]
MNVLIVEDDLNKLKQISELLHKELPGASIVERHSYQSGLKEVMTTRPDFVVLDMSMPTYDVKSGQQGGRTRAYAGREILSELARKRLKCKVVVVSQFESFHDPIEGRITLEELKVLLRRQFESNYLGAIYYNPAEAAWRTELTAILDQVRGM